jgi:hypothetical protein
MRHGRCVTFQPRCNSIEIEKYPVWRQVIGEGRLDEPAVAQIGMHFTQPDEDGDQLGIAIGEHALLVA